MSFANDLRQLHEGDHAFHLQTSMQQHSEGSSLAITNLFLFLLAGFTFYLPALGIAI